MRTVYVFLSLLLMCPLVLQAALPIEVSRPLYVGARALGMGNAFTAVADHQCRFWNPARLFMQGVKLFGVNSLQCDDTVHPKDRHSTTVMSVLGQKSPLC